MTDNIYPASDADENTDAIVAEAQRKTILVLAVGQMLLAMTAILWAVQYGTVAGYHWGIWISMATTFLILVSGATMAFRATRQQ